VCGCKDAIIDIIMDGKRSADDTRSGVRVPLRIFLDPQYEPKGGTPPGDRPTFISFLKN